MLTEYGHRQQEELLQKQLQLQQVHDHLMENSKSMLEAQVCVASFRFLTNEIVSNGTDS